VTSRANSFNELIAAWSDTGEYEVWADVSAQWWARYEVSSFGRLQNAGRILKTAPDAYGRPQVRIGGRGSRNVKVAHLVLTAFVGPRPPGLVCCHYNDIPDDNRVANLRWDTQRSNIRDLIRNGKHNETRKTHCPAAHEYTPENTIIIRDGTARRCRTCFNAARRERRRLHRNTKNPLREKETETWPKI
jgi:hypothetical protein